MTYPEVENAERIAHLGRPVACSFALLPPRLGLGLQAQMWVFVLRASSEDDKATSGSQEEMLSKR